jgi:hypothetical protein
MRSSVAAPGGQKVERIGPGRIGAQNLPETHFCGSGPGRPRNHQPVIEAGAPRAPGVGRLMPPSGHISRPTPLGGRRRPEARSPAGAASARLCWALDRCYGSAPRSRRLILLAPPTWARAGVGEASDGCRRADRSKIIRGPPRRSPYRARLGAHTAPKATPFHRLPGSDRAPPAENSAKSPRGRRSFGRDPSGARRRPTPPSPSPRPHRPGWARRATAPPAPPQPASVGTR